MKRSEAEKLIGSRVKAWTAANGEYVGVLEQVFGSPWRGSVRITGILKPAQHYERGSVCRRGFRVGELIEVGGNSISVTDEQGNESYLDVLSQSIAHCRTQLEKYPDSRNSWVNREFAKAMEEISKAEARRLSTGQWSLHDNKDTKFNQINGCL